MARKNFKEYLFVDGYNIINSWDVFKSKEIDSLEETRDYLIDLLTEYSAYNELRTILVFDAHLVKGNSGTIEEKNGMKIVYTQEFETADHYIERSISNLDKRSRARVATSDKLEQEIILSRGATRLSARELRDEVFSNKKTVHRKQDENNQKNNYHFGRLDDKNLEKLRKLISDE